jgi:hypothetical protein
MKILFVLSVKHRLVAELGEYPVQMRLIRGQLPQGHKLTLLFSLRPRHSG